MECYAWYVKINFFQFYNNQALWMHMYKFGKCVIMLSVTIDHFFFFTEIGQNRSTLCRFFSGCIYPLPSHREHKRLVLFTEFAKRIGFIVSDGPKNAGLMYPLNSSRLDKQFHHLH